MESTLNCNLCNQPIIAEKPVYLSEKTYHLECLKCKTCGKYLVNISDCKFHEGSVYCLAHHLALKHCKNYIAPTLISEVAFKADNIMIKSKYMNYLPQVLAYFPISIEESTDFLNNDGFTKLKNELNEYLDPKEFKIISMERGSLAIKIVILKDKAKEVLKNKLKGLIQKAGDILKPVINALEKPFKCLKNTSPKLVKVVDSEKMCKDQMEKEILELMQKSKKEKTNPETVSNYSGETFDSFSINNVDVDEIYEELEHIAGCQEKCVKEQFKEEFVEFEEHITQNEKFEVAIEDSKKESVFEYFITGLGIICKDDKKFQQNKQKCPNVQEKLLFHGTQENIVSKILSSQFLIGGDGYYGMGVYFTDQFDYARYYCGKSFENVNKIPRVGETFDIAASRVFYDKNKFKRICDYSYYLVLPKDESGKSIKPTELEMKTKYKKFLIEENGIHYAEVECKGTQVINENNHIVVSKYYFKDLSKSTYIGKEYVVSTLSQIRPKYAISFQRVEHFVLWRDPNFLSGVHKNYLEERKKYALEVLGCNLYIASSTEEALKILWRKKYNKPIIITNVGNKVGNSFEGKIFADKARIILKFDAPILFFANWVGSLKWIKNYPNSFFTNFQDLYEDYINNFNLDGLHDMKEKIENYYGYKLKPLNDPLEYPLFKNDGKYSDLNCGKYEDFSDEIDKAFNDGNYDCDYSED